MFLSCVFSFGIYCDMLYWCLIFVPLSLPLSKASSHKNVAGCGAQLKLEEAALELKCDWLSTWHKHDTNGCL